MALLVGAAAIACGDSAQSPASPPPSPAKLAFTVQPTSAMAGAVITPSPQVAIQDALGNTVLTATSAVTVAIGANPSGGTLSGTTTVNPVNGTASFQDLAIEKGASGYTLVASSIPLTSATSAAFNVAPAPISSLGINPGAALLWFPDGPMTVQLDAILLDVNGNRADSTVTWTSSDFAVASADAMGFVNGNQAGVATITATAAGRTATAIIAVDCRPPRCSSFNPPSIAFSQQPTSARVGAALVPPVQVSASSGSWSDIVLIALGNNPTGATLTGNSSVSIDGGTSRQWSDLRIDQPGNGYTLVAILRGSGSGVTSAPFNITP